METLIEDLAIAKAENALAPFQETAAGSMLNASGYSWQELQLPSARCDHAMVYDSAQWKVILFGGWDGNNNLSDGGDSWVASSSGLPSDGIVHSLAIDTPPAPRPATPVPGAATGRLDRPRPAS